METCTVEWTFGSPSQWASSSIACPSLSDAARVATQCQDANHTCPLLSLTITTGDHAARIRDGVWVSAPEGGWEDAA